MQMTALDVAYILVTTELLGSKCTYRSSVVTSFIAPMECLNCAQNFEGIGSVLQRVILLSLF